MPITPIPTPAPSDITQLKSLIDERILERQNLEQQKVPIQAQLNQINKEIDDLRTEIDIVLKLRERLVKRDPNTGEVIP